MLIFLHFIFGFCVGFVGVIPPGLLNLTAAKISVKQSHRAAVVFALGASFIVIAQVYVGVFFSKILSENPEILLTVEKFAITVFMALSIFFFIKARLDNSPKIQSIDKSDIRLFSQGVILSVLNPMAHLFIIGASIGTFMMLFAYIKYVKKFRFDSRTFARNINYILSGLTLIIAVFSLIRIYEIF